MNDTENQLKNRLGELSARAAGRCCYTFSSFLNADEQRIALTLKPTAVMTLTGGFENAERRIAVFGDEALCGYPRACALRSIVPLRVRGRPDP